MRSDDNDYVEIPPRRRDLYFRIMAGEPDVHPIAMRMYFLDMHFPPNLIDSALKWLIANNITGKQFVTWFRESCNASDLTMQSRLLAIVKNSPTGAIIAGKNFNV